MYEVGLAMAFLSAAALSACGVGWPGFLVLGLFFVGVAALKKI